MDTKRRSIKKMSSEIEIDCFKMADKYNGKIAYRVFKVAPYELIREQVCI